MLWEELTARQFAEAVITSEGVCILPIGVMERHGEHLPLGTDLYMAREVAVAAARQEPVVIFPPYYFSQIFEARHQPGTIALPADLLVQVLGAVCDEIARNGFTKIAFLNGHGGNTFFLKFFCQAQLERRRDYAVYLIEGSPEVSAIMKERKETRFDMHAGEWETSEMLAAHPDLVHMDEARRQPPAWGEGRLSHLKGAYTGIGWYANFPDHYAGDGAVGSCDKGRQTLDAAAVFVAQTLRSIKQDTATLQVQREFYDRADRPDFRIARADRRNE
jgi:creatinine amidohydrolase